MAAARPDENCADEAARAAGGDRRAFASLFQRHRGTLIAMARRRLGQRLRARLDSDDVLQEAFLGSLRAETAVLTDPERFHGAMAKVLDRTIVDLARHFARKKRASSSSPAPGESQSGPAAAERSPSQHAAGHEDCDAVHRAIAAMSDADRTVLTLARLEGRSTAEIAELLGEEREAVKRRLSRAMVRLGRRLMDDDA